VDCCSGDEEAQRLRRIPADTLVLLPDNRGYSGGVNAGLERARGATLLLCNADVAFQPGAVRELAGAVAERRVGAAAPLCLWDGAGGCGCRPIPPRGFQPSWA
jgi:GT2 family glycosyltransferase